MDESLTNASFAREHPSYSTEHPPFVSANALASTGRCSNASCVFENRSGARFCAMCGTPIAGNGRGASFAPEADLIPPLSCWRRLRLDMTEDQVRAVLGDPVVCREDAEGVVHWFYDPIRAGRERHAKVRFELALPQMALTLRAWEPPDRAILSTRRPG